MSKIKLAKRVKDLKGSATIEIADKVRHLEQNGKGIIKLATGEPHFATPKPIAEAACLALDHGETHYSHSRGIRTLRKALTDKLNQEYNSKLDPDCNIIVTPGCKQALFYLMLAVLEPGDEVLIQTPSWPSYSDIVNLAGGKSIYGLALSARTKAVIINSPNNPTGQIIDQPALQVLSDQCRRQGVLLISDEIYGEIIFNGFKHVSLLSVNSELENAVLLNGFSKAYAMTGWRLGYALAEPLIIDALAKLQQNSATCPVTFAQHGALKALSLRDEKVNFVKFYQKNRDYLLKQLGKSKLFIPLPPQGGLYIMVDVSRIEPSSSRFCLRLLEEYQISSVPGIAFGPGGEGLVRFCLATEQANLEKLVLALKNYEKNY